jgi:hypothetical protein
MSQEDAGAVEQTAETEPARSEGGEGGQGQEPEKFDREYVQQLRRENAQARKRAQEAEQRAKEYEDRDKTDQEKLNERATTAEKRAADAETRLLRHEVAAAKNVPANLAKFLTGSTKQELEKAADELLA